MRGKSLSLVLAIAMLLVHPEEAAACSVGPEYEPRDHTQLVVLGHARALELGTRTAGGYIEATVVLDVIHVYRGTAASSLRFVDRASVAPDIDPRSGQRGFVGSSGGCGTIDEDPIGQYVLVALARGEDARWHANRIFGAMYSHQPQYAIYQRLLQRHDIAIAFPLGSSARDAGSSGPLLGP